MSFTFSTTEKNDLPRYEDVVDMEKCPAYEEAVHASDTRV